jgi:ribosomal protein L27
MWEKIVKGRSSQGGGKVESEKIKALLASRRLGKSLVYPGNLRRKRNVEGATDKHCLWSLANSSIPAPTMIITQRAGKWQEACWSVGCGVDETRYRHKRGANPYLSQP